MNSLWFNSFMADVNYYWYMYFKELFLDIGVITFIIMLNTAITVYLIKRGTK